MKVVILAGGLPSNISDDNDKIPKPMLRIGERPILWHIMKLYSYYGYHDFIICTGYQGEQIKRYFMDYYIYQSDITVDLEKNDITIHNNVAEPWNVTIVNTGMQTTTAERVRRILPYIEEEDFIVSYGDCISNIRIDELVKAHLQSGKGMTVTLTRPTGRNQIIPFDKDGNMVQDTNGESGADAWVNACNMIVKKAILETVSIHDGERFEIETLNALVKMEEVDSYKHDGFWLPVETMRDKIKLQTMWDQKNIPWKVWQD